ncbi:leucine-rich repeat-containing protein 74B-like isoform X2 [Lineus longissimus]|uniref:leucine-rich repeat-containing protein 74B-like isoform X2 n=1 Tax=Lineus longissimus TaxID=88925 RepID=UPI00315DCD9D
MTSTGIANVTSIGPERFGERESLDNWGQGRGKRPPRKTSVPNARDNKKRYGVRKASIASEGAMNTKSPDIFKIESNIMRTPPKNGRRAVQPVEYTIEQSLQRIPTKEGLNKRTASLYLSRATTKITIKDANSPSPELTPRTTASRRESINQSRFSMVSRVADSRTSVTTSGPVANNLLTLHREYTREFTFTGYDIMKDVAKKTTVDNKEELNRLQKTQVYEGTCKKLGITPATYVTRNLSSRDIIMKSHELGPLGARAVAIALVNNDKVERLDVSDNHIGNDGVKAISDMCHGNSVLTHICLGWNQMTTDGVRAICSSLKENQNIKKLDLSGNHLKDQDARYVADLVENNVSLRELILSHNDFREMGGELLSKALGYNDTIEHLDLSWNHLRGKGAVSIGKCLQQNLGLKKLNLSWNGFGEDGGKALGASLLKNKTMLELDLTNNRITPGGIKAIMNGVLKNDTLKILHLGRNPITPEVAKNILNYLQKITDRCGLEEILMDDITVDVEFVQMLAEIRERRYIKVSHGPIIKLSTDHVAAISDVFMDRDPVKTLFDFMAAEGLRVVDLFNRLDEDKSMSVSKKEFRDGMVKIKVPLTLLQLDILMDKLDKDNDGEVDLRSLLVLLEGGKRLLVLTLFLVFGLFLHILVYIL